MFCEVMNCFFCHFARKENVYLKKENVFFSKKAGDLFYFFFFVIRRKRKEAYFSTSVIPKLTANQCSTDKFWAN